MRIILSPAKKMNVNTDTLAPQGTPVFMEQTAQLLRYLQGLSYDEAKKLWGCNDKIAEQNFIRIHSMNLYQQLTPAILSYEGIAYQYMAPAVFERCQYDYVQDHLRILSAFYGVLKPMDGVTPYRLEMQTKAKVDGTNNLYDYWGRRIYQEILDASHIIINLASKEYARCIEKYLTPEDTWIQCVFGEYSGEKIVQKGVCAKMARGEMVRFMAEYQIEDPEEIKKFDRLGYVFQETLSDQRTFVFLK